MASGKEEHSNKSGRNSSRKSSDGSGGNFLRSAGFSVGMFLSGSDHVGFQETSFPEDFVFLKSLNTSGQNSLSHFLASFDRVVAIGQNFGFNNRNQTVSLANLGISSQAPSVLLNSLLRRQTITDFKDSAPLGESATNRVVLMTKLSQRVQTLGPSLLVSALQISSTFVDLDSGHDSLLEQSFGELFAIEVGAVGSFGEHDNTRNVLFDALGVEEQLSVSDSVVQVVFDLDVVETLANRSG